MNGRELNTVKNLALLGCKSFKAVNSKGDEVVFFKTPDGFILKNLEQGYCWLLQPWSVSNKSPDEWLESQFPRWHLKTINDLLALRSDWQDFRCGAIYFMFKGENLVYIGKSLRLSERIKHHTLARNQYDTIHFIDNVPHFFLEMVEMFYIHKFKPPLNLQYLPVCEVLQNHLEEVR